MKKRLVAFLAVLTLYNFTPAGFAKQPTAKQERLVKDVFQSLMAHVDDIEGYDAWPPNVAMYDDDKIPAMAVNAFAGLDPDQYDKHDKHIPIVRVSEAYLRTVLAGDRDVLAMTLSHELGHVCHKHCLRAPSKTPLIHSLYRQEDEYQADAFAADLMRKAEFSVTRALALKSLRLREAGMHDAPLEMTGTTHPAWSDRFGRLSQDPRVWELMALFENGCALLAAEQYAAAEKCLVQVTAADPTCYEAQVDLGYARLMQYCDQLNQTDLQKRGVGQLICGAFYRRAKSLEPTVRGADNELWRQAVKALNAALKRKPELALARANLGVAYLVHPSGTKADRAVEELEAAHRAMKSKDSASSRFDQAVVQINLGTARLAAGQREVGVKDYDEAANAVNELKKTTLAMTGLLDDALRYNRAAILADSNDRESKRKAAQVFEAYLRDSDSNSTWWSVAYQRYADLCHSLESEPLSEQSLKQVAYSRLREVTTVVLRGGKLVSRGEKTTDVVDRLGKHTVLEVKDSNLKRYRFPKQAIEILATDRVQAIILASEKSPSVEIRPQGLSAGNVIPLRVGMSRREFLEKFPIVQMPTYCGLVEPGTAHRYNYYPLLGLAIRYDGTADGIISELVLVQTE